jgi:hypothetical protein
MMRNLLTFALVLAVLAATAQLTAQPPPEIKPGPEHALLKESEGTWDAAIKSMGNEYTGTEKCKMALNGLWLLEGFKADFGGMPFEGHGATSYDSAKKKYVNVWIDSMTTRPMISEGTYEKDTKTMRLVGSMATPDGKDMKTIMTTVFNDADTKTFTLKTPGEGGKEVEMLHITYKRRGK